ncbi:MAG: hypothetical protein JXA43_02190 [Candidatus Diapherotrites archaeon]|nr:hypothetical protein [Candidatus Diapherotrites archaeon]
MGKPLSLDAQKEIIDAFEQTTCQFYLSNEKLQISSIAEKTHELLDFDEKPSIGTIKQMFSPGRHSFEALSEDLKEQVDLIRDFVEPKEGPNAFSDSFKSEIVKTFDEITQQHIKNKGPLTLDSIGEEVIKELKDEELIALNTIKNMFNPNNPSFNNLSRTDKHKVRRLRRVLKLKRKGIKTLTPEMRDDVVSLAEAVYSLKPEDLLEDLETQEKSKLSVREISRMIELALEEEHGPLDNSIRYMISGVGPSFDAMNENNKGRLQLINSFLKPQSRYTDKEKSRILDTMQNMFKYAKQKGQDMTVSEVARQIELKKGISKNTISSWFVEIENIDSELLTPIQKRMKRMKEKHSKNKMTNELFAEAMNVYEGILWGLDEPKSKRMAIEGAALATNTKEGTLRARFSSDLYLLNESNKGRVILDLPAEDDKKKWSDEEKENIINFVLFYAHSKSLNKSIALACAQLGLSNKVETVRDFFTLNSRGYKALPDYLKDKVCRAHEENNLRRRLSEKNKKEKQEFIQWCEEREKVRTKRLEYEDENIITPALVGKILEEIRKKLPWKTKTHAARIVLDIYKHPNLKLNYIKTLFNPKSGPYKAIVKEEPYLGHLINNINMQNVYFKNRRRKRLK